MTELKAIPATAFAVSMLFVAPGVANAQDTGSFYILNSFAQDYTTIDHAGGTVTGGSLFGTATVMESSGPPFTEGETSIVRCIVFARALQGGAVELEAPCAITDGAGDEMYLLARRGDGDVAAGGGGAGVYEIMGGTGKYAGISGECPYEAQYLPENRAVTTSECTWQRP